MSTLEGGCLCGAIRYRVSGKPANTMICHCRTCRRAAGSPVVAPTHHSWLSHDIGWVRFGDGLPAFPQSRPR
jgi:hypothetical protein